MGAAAYSPSPKQDTLSPDFPRFLQGEERGISFLFTCTQQQLKEPNPTAGGWRRRHGHQPSF